MTELYTGVAAKGKKTDTGVEQFAVIHNGGKLKSGKNAE